MAKGLDSKMRNLNLNVEEVLNHEKDVENTKEVERVKYTREEQLEKFGYITARDLTADELASLDKVELLVSVSESTYQNNSRTFYRCRALFTNRLIVNVNFSNDTKRPIFMNEDTFNLFAGIFNLNTDKYKEFKIKVPYRLFKGQSNNQTYYQYELIIAKSITRTKVVRQFFTNDQIMLIEYNDDLLNKFFERKTLNDDTDTEAIGNVDE